MKKILRIVSNTSAVFETYIEYGDKDSDTYIANTLFRTTESYLRFSGEGNSIHTTALEGHRPTISAVFMALLQFFNDEKNKRAIQKREVKNFYVLEPCDANSYWAIWVNFKEK